MRTLAVPVELMEPALKAIDELASRCTEDLLHAKAHSLSLLYHNLRALLSAPGVEEPHPLMNCSTCGQMRGHGHECETPAPEER